MARTISEIYSALVGEKESFSSLADLTPAVDSYQNLLRDLSTTSQVAIWRMLLYVVAVAIHLQEVYYDLFIAELEELKPTIITGTDVWYAQKAKEFQYGDSLTWNGSQYVYETLDSTKQIVVFSSAVSDENVLKVKVAKDNGSGLPEKLSTAELSAFDAYMQEIGFVGTYISTISTDGDVLWLAANIYRNPLVLNSDGTSVETGASVVEDAINDYIANLDFNGIFRVMDLVDAIQAVSGVENVVITTCKVAINGGSLYTDILLTDSQSYTPVAGYMIEDTANPYNLTYL